MTISGKTVLQSQPRRWDYPILHPPHPLSRSMFHITIGSPSPPSLTIFHHYLFLMWAICPSFHHLMLTFKVNNYDHPPLPSISSTTAPLEIWSRWWLHKCGEFNWNIFTGLFPLQPMLHISLHCSTSFMLYDGQLPLAFLLPSWFKPLPTDSSVSP